MAYALAGAWSWQRRVARSASGLPLLFLLSCLVTDHPEYGEPNVPAHLVRGLPRDFERARPAPECVESNSWMPFHVEVTDANIDDNLEARIYVNGDWLANRNVQILRTGLAERAPLVMCADQTNFNSPCNLVEIRVSRRFALNDVFAPLEPGDLAIVSWWIFDESIEEQEVLPADCAMQQVPMGRAP
jgi:hypothetical protein